MLKKLKEKFSKKVTVSLVILGLLFLAFYGAGFIEARWFDRGKTKITQNSSFFDRNSKEIVEGFKETLLEEDSDVRFGSVDIQKGKITIVTTYTDREFDCIEYVLTENDMEIRYIAHDEMNEEMYKQLVCGVKK